MLKFDDGYPKGEKASAQRCIDQKCGNVSKEKC
jgi:hypothetical protein